MAEKQAVKNSGYLKNTIGMFDLFKGVGMLLVLFGHTVSLYSINLPAVSGQISLLINLFLQVIRAGLMPAFFLVSGYGFRSRPLRKCVKQQITMILKPYGYVAAGTSLLHLVLHYGFFGYWPGAVKETLKMAAGFLLALPKGRKIFGVEIFWCGAVWYLAALFVGWIVLNGLMRVLPEQYVPTGMVLAVLLGWLIGRNRITPFCISQGLIAAGGIYAGYRIKKKKILQKPFYWYEMLFAVLISLILTFTTVYTGHSDNMADGIWGMGPLSIVFDFFLGYVLLRFFLWLNRFENPLFHALQRIGRYSLWIFCIHTVEMLAIPWYLFAEHWKGQPEIGLLLHFLLRVLLIFAGCVLIQNKKIMIRKGK